jgi:hypothetical protein
MAGVRYNERMKTLTITEGRGRLGYWLKQAAQGEDIGFMFEVSTDYALQEYGLTDREMAKAAPRIRRGIASERRNGTLKTFTGKLSDLRA